MNMTLPKRVAEPSISGNTPPNAAGWRSGMHAMGAGVHSGEGSEGAGDPLQLFFGNEAAENLHELWMFRA